MATNAYISGEVKSSPPLSDKENNHPLTFPDNKTFFSKSELLEYARKVALDMGFVLVIRGSGAQSRHLYLKCDRGGVYKRR